MVDWSGEREGNAMADHTNDLNSISDSVLGEDSAAYLDPSAPIQEIANELSANRQRTLETERLVKKLRLELLNLPKIHHLIAWRCTHVFKHQNGRVCNTLNGLQKNGKVARKLCVKCQQRRTNPKTILEEYREIAGDRIKQDLIEAGISEVEAERQIELIISGEV